MGQAPNASPLDNTPAPPRAPGPPSEWDTQANSKLRPFGQAGLLLWIIGGAELIVGSLLAIMALLGATLSVQQLERADHDTRQIDAILAVQPLMLPMAATCLLLAAVPGGVIIYLGFAVRRRRPLAIQFAYMLSLTQAIVLAVLLTSSIVIGIHAGQPTSVTGHMLILGTPLAMLIYVIMLLLHARRLANQED